MKHDGFSLEWVLFAATIVSIPFYGFPATSVGNRPIRWDYILMTVFICFVIFRQWRRERSLRIHAPLAVTFLFVFHIFALLSISSPLRVGIEAAIMNFLTTWGQLVLYSAFLVTAFSLDLNRRSLWVLLRLYIILAVAIALFGIVQSILANLFGSEVLYLRFTNPKFSVARSGYEWRLGLLRATSVFAEPRHFGNFMLPPLLVVITDFLSRSRRLFALRRSYILITGFLGTGLLISFSTSAYAMAAVGFAVLPLWISTDACQIFNWYRNILGSVVGLSLVLSISPVGNQVWLTFERLLLTPSQLVVATDLGTHPPGGLIRYIWSSLYAVTIGLGNPILGVGLNQLSRISNWSLWMFPPLKLLASVGMVGFFSFLAFIGTFLLGLIRRRFMLSDSNRELKSLLGIATLFIFVPFAQYWTGSRFNIGNSWFWVLLSFAAVIYVHADKRT